MKFGSRPWRGEGFSSRKKDHLSFEIKLFQKMRRKKFQSSKKKLKLLKRRFPEGFRSSLVQGRSVLSGAVLGILWKFSAFNFPKIEGASNGRSPQKLKLKDFEGQVTCFSRLASLSGLLWIRLRPWNLKARIGQGRKASLYNRFLPPKSSI